MSIHYCMSKKCVGRNSILCSQDTIEMCLWCMKQMIEKGLIPNWIIYMITLQTEIPRDDLDSAYEQLDAIDAGYAEVP